MNPKDVVVVGCGVVSEMHLRGLANHRDRVNVVAVVDPTTERTRWAQDEFGIPRAFASVDEALNGVSFDVAVVCTPSHVRSAATVPLLSAGKHVLVEKPLADDYAEATKLVELAAKHQVHLSVDQNFRDHYPFRLAREIVQAGDIGEPIGIEQREFQWREVKDWRATARHHAMAVMGIHWFDGFRFTLGREATSIWAHVATNPTQDATGETDAFVQVMFDSTPVNYVESFSSRMTHVETVLLGTEGTLQMNYQELLLHTASGTTRRTDFLGGSQKPESAFRQLEHLLVAIDSGTEAENSGQDNLKTLSLLFGAYRSAELGERIQLKGGLL